MIVRVSTELLKPSVPPMKMTCSPAASMGTEHAVGDERVTDGLQGIASEGGGDGAQPYPPLCIKAIHEVSD